MEKANFNDLINKAKSSNTAKVIQKITPVKQTQNDEIQFSFYIEKDLLKSIKFKALENNMSIKSIINNAIKDFLEKGKKN